IGDHRRQNVGHCLLTSARPCTRTVRTQHSSKPLRIAVKRPYGFTQLAHVRAVMDRTRGGTAAGGKRAESERYDDPSCPPHGPHQPHAAIRRHLWHQPLRPISLRGIGRRATTASASFGPPHHTRILSSSIDTLGLAVIVGQGLSQRETNICTRRLAASRKICIRSSTANRERHTAIGVSHTVSPCRSPRPRIRTACPCSTITSN